EKLKAACLENSLSAGHSWVVFTPEPLALLCISLPLNLYLSPSLYVSFFLSLSLPVSPSSSPSLSLPLLLSPPSLPHLLPLCLSFSLPPPSLSLSPSPSRSLSPALSHPLS